MTAWRRRIGGALLATALVAVASGCSAAEVRAAPTPSPSAPAPPQVGSIVVIGDSISLGVAACGTADACAEASWAIGTDPAVASIASRVAELTGSAPRTEAVARPGARIADAEAALPTLADSDADLVLVLVGANDACTASAASMTAPGDFADSYAALLTGVSAALPDARIVALSLPDLLQLWQLGSTDPATVQAWSRSPSCRSLLQNAASVADADIERRAAVDELVTAYDDAIADACAAIVSCTFDAGAVHAVRFDSDDVSTVDRFHPSLQGQAKLAEAAWSAVAAAIDPAAPAG
ncbi:SGNH/GDSL hydrolase family protein [Microbacterium sp. NPDC058389]|uniref:SGNH/GDSL hydrolase family protein n=1 Tax=Microbacterium sp. NPDC058389 TaxID=3346475 RepID=UPI0036637C9D